MNTSTAMTATQFFDGVYAKVSTEVVYDPQWENGTGYFDGAVKARLGIRAGEVAKATDPKGRRIVLVGTPFGNAVVFDRKPSGEFQVKNLPKVIEYLIGYSEVMFDGSIVTLEGMYFLYGNPDTFLKAGDGNIGTRLKYAVEMAS